MARIEASQSSDVGFESHRSDSLSNICKPLLIRIAAILPISRLRPLSLMGKIEAFQASGAGFNSRSGHNTR